MRLRDWLIPNSHRLVLHPVYRLQVGRNRFDVVQFTLRRLIVIGGLIVSGWMALVLLYQGQSYTIIGPSTNVAYYTSDNIVLWLVLIGGVGSLVLDFASLAASISGIDRHRPDWELLRLTNLNRQDVIGVKHILAQIRVWQVTTFFLVLRVTALIIVLLQNQLLTDFDDPLFLELWTDFVRNPFETSISVLMMVFVTYCFVFELLWRMRAVTAIGTALSARMDRSGLAFLVGFALVTVMWAVLVLLLVVFTWAYGQMVMALFALGVRRIVLLQWVYLLLIGLIVYNFFSQIQIIGVSWATRAAFRE